MINENELAWAAGFIDGEGCWYCGISQRNGRPKRDIILCVGQSEPSTLERLKTALLGKGTIRLVKKTGTFRYRKPDFYEYRLSGFNQVEQALDLLGHLLSPPKQKQARDALEKYNTCPVNPVGRPRATRKEA